METSYKNSFYNKHYQNSVPVISTKQEPEIYKCFKIYHGSWSRFDIVLNNVCIGMYAGVNGAKRQIDYLVSTISKYPSNEWVKPTNNGSNDYDVFANLFEWGMVERKIEDHYRGKTFIGTTQYFKHNLI